MRLKDYLIVLRFVVLSVTGVTSMEMLCIYVSF